MYIGEPVDGVGDRFEGSVGGSLPVDDDDGRHQGSDEAAEDDPVNGRTGGRLFREVGH